MENPIKAVCFLYTHILYLPKKKKKKGIINFINSKHPVTELTPFQEVWITPQNTAEEFPKAE